MKQFDYSPLQDSFVQNPYAAYSEALADQPIRYWPAYGMPAVFDAATIQQLLRDRRLGRAPMPTETPEKAEHLTAFDAVEAHSMLDLEPPRHTRLRGLVLRAFTSRRIKALAPDIEEISADLLNGLPADAFDLLPSYCAPLPVRVIARLLGVPESIAPDLLNWSNAMVAMYMAGRDHETERHANAAARAFTEFLSGYIEDRRAKPADDLITHLIAAEDDGKKLSRDEMISTCILLLNAGHEATVHTMGNAVKCLLEHEIPTHALSDENIPNTVEEVLRFDPPLHVFTRVVYEGIEVGGHPLTAGDEIALVLGSAGRDPKLGADPDRFDPFRPAAAHAAFGAGLHFCIGAPLARLELQIGLQALFRAAPNLQLTKRPNYASIYHFHGLESLWVQK